MAELTRICTVCGVEKILTQFKLRSSRGRQAGTRQAQCRRCQHSRYEKPHADRKTQLVRDFKVSKGCADCGYDKHPSALEFDHLPGTEKLFNIGEKVASYAIERIWAEIAKCEVVCANCHAIRTAARRDEVAV